eukprot:7448405-Pyramimonas_sp.AAC.1
MERGCHANHATQAISGAPYGATSLVKGVPTWPEDAMRTLPLVPSVEFPWDHDPREVCVPKSGWVAMRTLPLRHSVEFPWGHDPREGCAETAWRCHANLATQAFGGIPMGPPSS